MIDQRTPGIEPPPSLDDILSHSDRIGRVDFSHSLVPEAAPEAAPEPAPETERPETADEARDVEDTAADAVPEGRPVDAGAPAVEEEAGAEIQTARDVAAEEPAPAVLAVDEPDEVHHDLLHGHHDAPYGDAQEDREAAEVLDLSEPTSALLSLVPAEDAAVVAEDVDDVVTGVIGRIREVRSATIAHLEAIEVESALRCEMLTAQAELDAELIRLHARREAHAIIAAARHRSGLPPRPSDDEQRLRELYEAATRLSEELEELDVRRGSPDHPFPR